MSWVWHFTDFYSRPAFEKCSLKLYHDVGSALQFGPADVLFYEGYTCTFCDNILKTSARYDV